MTIRTAKGPEGATLLHAGDVSGWMRAMADYIEAQSAQDGAAAHALAVLGDAAVAGMMTEALAGSNVHMLRNIADWIDVQCIDLVSE